MHQYKYSLTELENMVPFERDLYISMLNTWVKDEEERINAMKMQQEQNHQKTLNAIKKSSRR